MYGPAVARRFWGKVARGEPDECWLWQGGRFRRRGGYGRFCLAKRRRRAHRVAWELTHGAIPVGQVVRHSCDTPACVNPAHLLLGAQADNVSDRVERGREGNRKGVRNGRAKVTPEVVRDIRQRSRVETLVSIARDVGLSATAVGHIVQRKLWPHVT